MGPNSRARVGGEEDVVVDQVGGGRVGVAAKDQTQADRLRGLTAGGGTAGCGAVAKEARGQRRGVAVEDARAPRAGVVPSASCDAGDAARLQHDPPGGGVVAEGRRPAARARSASARARRCIPPSTAQTPGASACQISARTPGDG